MKKIILIFTLAFLLILISSIYAEVSYPVAELGNCNSQAECEKYCDDAVNMEPCLNFAEKNNLMSSEEIEEARKFMPLLKEGNTPGSCKNHRECDEYCDRDENLNECIDFALKAGVISSEEAEMVKKTGGKGPGGCKGKKECDSFCNDEGNFNVCIDFAVEHGLVSSEEAEMAKKTGGKGPGGCKSKEACDAYCKENEEECRKWGEEHGFAKEGGGEFKGPGGCKSDEECKAFCDDPANSQTCAEYSIENGFMTQEEYDRQMQERENMEDDQGPRGTGSEEQGGPQGEYTGSGENQDNMGRQYEGGSESSSEGSGSESSSSGSGEGSTSSGGGGDSEGSFSGTGSRGSDSSSGGGSESASSSTSSGGGGSDSSSGSSESSVTGGVISEGNSNNWLIKIIKFIFNIN